MHVKLLDLFTGTGSVARDNNMYIGRHHHRMQYWSFPLSPPPPKLLLSPPAAQKGAARIATGTQLGCSKYLAPELFARGLRVPLPERKKDSFKRTKGIVFSKTSFLCVFSTRLKALFVLLLSARHALRGDAGGLRHVRPGRVALQPPHRKVSVPLSSPSCIFRCVFAFPLPARGAGTWNE